MKKINATVAILTLNSDRTLDRCLKSIQDFDEILICDGNSTDNTLKIARTYGARIVTQFKSHKKNIRITDKSKARNVALNKSKNDWHVYLDSDDDLSQEVVNEIRVIVNSRKHDYFIYEMPLRPVISGKPVRYASHMPLYQPRLFNKRSGAKFIKPVHETVEYNKQKYVPGRLDGFYNVRWDKKRVRNYRKIVEHYNRLELDQVKTYISWRWYKRWVLGFQVPVLIGMIGRSVWQYLRHGFSETMPVRVEVEGIRGKVLLIYALTRELVKKRGFYLINSTQ